MARVRSPWHALRPVFLAGAAAFTWMTFSSSPASADLLPEPTPVVKEISVNAPSTDLLDPVAGVAPGSGPAAPVTAIADDAVDQAAAPPVSGLVEATEPVIAPVLESAEPVLAPVEPVVAPLVKPVTELVAALEPIVALAPQAPVQAVAGLLPDAATAPSTTAPAVGGSTSAAGPAPTAAAPRPSLDAAGPASFAPPAVTAVANPLWAAPSAPVESVEKAPVPPSSPPAPVPTAPGSGGAASGGPSPGSTAWLSPLPLGFPLLGAASALDFVLHAPEPVSFDPGSSPD